MKWKVGDEFVLVKSGKYELDRLFSEQVFNQKYTVERILEKNHETWGTVYKCNNENIGAVKLTMIPIDVYYSPLNSALEE